MRRHIRPIKITHAMALETEGDMISGSGPLTPIAVAVIQGDVIVYCECDHDHKPKKRRVWLMPDGDVLPSYAQIYVATVQHNGAAWHVWTEYAPN